MQARPEDVQATFAATLVDEWAHRGVAHAVVAPGSRSTPLAVALAGHAGVEVHVHHDERSAAFLALGIGLATGRPAVVLTTSGTAAAELHAAVVEADLAGVPMLVCTADRPPELQDVGAPQAIDQTHLFGRSVRWFHAPGVAEASGRGRWRVLARRALAEASGPRPGPVHLNLAFREPLLGAAGDLPPRSGPSGASEDTGGGDDAGPGPSVGPEADGHGAAAWLGDLVLELVGRRGVFVAGPGSGHGSLLHEVAQGLGWPILAAPQAEVWGVPGAVVPAADALLRSPWLAEALRPEVVVRLGLPMASKVVGEWVAASGARELAVAGPGRWIDPHGTVDEVLPLSADVVLEAWARTVAHVRPLAGGAWRDLWVEAGRGALDAIGRVLEQEGALTEPGLVRDVAAAMPLGGELVVSSSMPVRDLEWFAEPRVGLRVHANRGANGIDGVVSTAVGVAVGSGHPTALLIGDVALLHDSNGLLGLAARGVDLVVVVVDNDGGGIFSFLPQAGALDPTTFETLFGTPHGVDLVALASAFGVAARAVTGPIGAAVQEAFEAGGAQVLVARTDRSENVAVHARLHDAVRRALDAER